MKVKFRTNLGSRDAGELGLNHEKCQSGAETVVSEDVGKTLVSRGWAEVVESDKPKSVKAVPDKPAVAESKPAPLAGKAKDDK